MTFIFSHNQFLASTLHFKSGLRLILLLAQRLSFSILYPFAKIYRFENKIYIRFLSLSILLHYILQFIILRNIYFIYIELHLCHHYIYFIFLYFFYFYKIILFILLENFISLYFIHKYHFLMLFSLLCVTYLATKFSNLNF